MPQDTARQETGRDWTFWPCDQGQHRECRLLKAIATGDDPPIIRCQCPCHGQQ